MLGVGQLVDLECGDTSETEADRGRRTLSGGHPGLDGIRSDRDPPAQKSSWYRRLPLPCQQSRPAPKARSTRKGWSSWGLLQLHKRSGRRHRRPSSLRRMLGPFVLTRSDVKHTGARKFIAPIKAIERHAEVRSSFRCNRWLAKLLAGNGGLLHAGRRHGTARCKARRTE